MKSKFLCLVLAFVMAFVLVGCGNAPTPTLTLEEPEVNIYVGKSYTVKPLLENATNSALTLTAENPAIVTIEGNKVVGQVAGTTNVTVALVSHPNVTASLKVNVLEQPSITINVNELVEIHEGATYQVPVITTGVPEITWTSSNPAAATVDANGLVTGVKAGGVARIKAEYGEYSAHVDVSVTRGPEIRIDGPTTVNVGDTIKLEDYTYKIDEEIEWSSSNEEIASITTKGVVKGIAAGEVTIILTAGEYKAEAVITVLPAPAIEITGETSMYKGKTTQLSINWINLEESEVTWSSADTAVATVDNNGLVTAIEAGIAKITAKAGECVAEFQISIQLEPTVTISGNNSVCVTEQVKLELTIENMEIPDGIIWESSDAAVATVDNNGVVTGLAVGTVTITVVAGDRTATYEVSVRAMDDKVTYHFDGGVSAELYNSTPAVADFTLTSYNSNSGAFWGGGYSSNIYICTQGGDPKATFSDRIYIGKNQYTGYYEVKQILLSGGSTWHEEAEYVICISSSYSGYRAVHAQVQKIALGDIIILPEDITGISKTATCPAKFYNPKLSVDTLDVLKADFDGTLVAPQKLGFDFLGWYDKDNNKVETVAEVSGKVELFAKWNEKNPVTDINVNQIPAEMVTGDSFTIEASITPTDAFFQEVLISTSNKDLISLEGTTITAKSAGTATITITDYVGKIVKTYEIVVNSIPSIDLSFDESYTGVLKPGEKLQLNPVYVGKALEGLSFEYKSSDAAVATVDAAGEITAVANGEVEITIKATAGEKSYELVVGVTVSGLTEADKIDEVINLLANTNFAEVEVGNMCLYNDGTNRYYDSSYGSVNKFLFEPLVYDETYNEIADNNKNHGVERSKSEIYFVTVHDTATLTGTPEAIASNMATGSSVSIHYSVSNGIVWRVLSEKYVAWHAGDGTGVQFEWLPTGVKGEEGVQPEFDMIQEGSKYYFTVNGTKTNIEVPISNGGRTIQNPSKAHFSRLGPTWMVKNGQIYMGKPWASFGQVAAGVISSRGGNNNSVGIEMSVNTSGDIYDTYQRTAKLVADILIRNNLDLTRVKQHNTFDGKNCPQGLIAGNYWDQFMSMVEINYILMKDYKDVKIEFKSNNPDIIGDNGRVINPPAVTTTVSYEVTVTVGSSSKTIKLYSVVPGSTTWEQWDGSYSSSIIWNNGNYSL